MSDRLSKKSLAKIVYNRIKMFYDRNKFDPMDGTHQFYKLFNDKLIKSINDLKEVDNTTEEGWNKRVNAEKVISELIGKLMEYGKKEELNTISYMFDLYSVNIEE